MKNKSRRRLLKGRKLKDNKHIKTMNVKKIVLTLADGSIEDMDFSGAATAITITDDAGVETKVFPLTTPPAKIPVITIPLNTPVTIVAA
jgi:hypothetical protein